MDENPTPQPKQFLAHRSNMVVWNQARQRLEAYAVTTNGELINFSYFRCQKENLPAISGWCQAIWHHLLENSGLQISQIEAEGNFEKQ